MKKNRFNIIIILVITGLMLFFMFAVDGPKVLLSAIKTAKLGYILCAGLCMLVYWLLEASAFQRVCRGLKSRITYKDCFQTSMVGQMFNCLTPFASGGQPMQAYRLTKCGMSIGQASCALLAKFITYQCVLTLYTLAVIIVKLKFFMTEVSGFALLILVGFGANTVVMAFIIGVGFFPKPTTKLLMKLAKLLGKIKLVKNPQALETKIIDETTRFYENFAQLKANPTRFIAPALITVVQLTAFFTVPYFVCLSLSVTGINYFTVLCAAAFVLLISSFVPLPGGSGGAEGGFYLFFGMFFVQTGILSVAIILWRILTFYLPIVAGMCFSKMVPNKTTKAVKAVLET